MRIINLQAFLNTQMLFYFLLPSTEKSLYMVGKMVIGLTQGLLGHRLPSTEQNCIIHGRLNFHTEGPPFIVCMCDTTRVHQMLHV